MSILCPDNVPGYVDFAVCCIILQMSHVVDGDSTFLPTITFIGSVAQERYYGGWLHIPYGTVHNTLHMSIIPHPAEATLS